MDIMDMLRMERIFHPVGQGAFYSEHFCEGLFCEWLLCDGVLGKRRVGNRRVNVVYDCGTSTGKRYIEREIKEGFEKGEIIDAVFISHLHDDHINGIPYLIRHCDVKRIFFPLLETPENKLLVKLKAIVERADEFSVEFIDSPPKAIDAIESEYSHNIELIGVRVNKDNERLKRDFNTVDEFDEGIDGICHHTLPSGMNVAKKIHTDLCPLIGSRESYWIYIPYNFEFTSRIDELLTELERKGFTLDKLIELGEAPEKYKNTIDLIIKPIYRRLSKDFNSHSMTVFSGGKNLNIHRIGVETGDDNCLRVIYESPEFIARNRENERKGFSKKASSGCLYTGDYKLDSKKVANELKKAYNLFWEDLLLMQVPHHGSERSYCGELVKSGVIYIVSAGFKNRFKHPSGYVINDISANGGHPVVITEYKDSRISVGILFD